MEDFDFDAEIPILVIDEHEICDQHVMGYHDYIRQWQPQIGKRYATKMEPENTKDRFAVAVLNRRGRVSGHLMKGKTGRFAKTVFYFLRADSNNKCYVEILAAPVNQGDGMGMKVPCSLHFVGRCDFITLLKSELIEHM